MRGARAGDVINLRTPTGLEDIEILMIRYEPKR
jgi:transcription elongation GreA/GreB family factor